MVGGSRLLEVMSSQLPDRAAFVHAAHVWGLGLCMKGIL